MTFAFERGWVLWMLGLAPLLWVFAWRGARTGITFSRAELAAEMAGRTGWSGAVALVPSLLRTVAVIALLLALADPYFVRPEVSVASEEIAVVMAVDLSGSMRAEDMGSGQNRMDVARETVIRFVRGRDKDRVGVTAFAGEALTRIPPTSDLDAVIAGVESLDAGLLDDGTDITAAILTSVARLSDLPHATKVIVLLTDGAHNGEGLPPAAAAAAAARAGIRIYSVSVLGGPASASSMGGQDDLAREMETVLSQVARLSGGRYFHAGSGASLDSIYDQINRLETTPVDLLEQTVRLPLRGWLLLAAALLASAEVAFRGSRYGVIP
jgi:Ca-activated chloride channel family protein